MQSAVPNVPDENASAMELTEVPKLTADMGIIRGWLNRVDYKDGWELIPYAHPYEGPYLQIKVEQPNAYPNVGTVTLKINTAIPNVAMTTDLSFFEWLLWRLRQVEIHEVMEFFKVDGEPYRDPHDVIEP